MNLSNLFRLTALIALGTVTSLLGPATLQARVRLPHLIADRMVLQHSADVRLWGWAAPGRIVRVSPSWAHHTYKTQADPQGRWQLRVHTPEASYRPLSITFDDGDKLTVGQILAGEVWVCAGQSNMEMPVKGFDGCPVEGYHETLVASAETPGIHFVKIPSAMSMTPLDDASCQWVAATPNTVAECSAVGYAFARELTRVLHIPVGLILANKGGTRVESWLDRANLVAHTDEPLDTAAIVQRFPMDYHRPLLWGNGTFHPILPYTVKGILFYQGCSNVGDPANRYSERLGLLVEQWRRDFGQPQLPFYFVQIAPYSFGDPQADWAARLREQQHLASTLIPHSGMVTTIDLAYPYEQEQIHPCQKRQVGQRLAWMALHRQYAQTGIPCQSPSYRSLHISADSCYIALDHLEGGLNRLQGLEGFEVAGADRVFHPATGTYSWDKGLVVTSPRVSHPVAVRYRFRNFPTSGNVTSQAGLPLLPFRTDTW